MKVSALKFDERGLLPAVVQDARTGEVLTLAYMNADSLARTLATGETWFWSRSRAALWHKGETSGHTQRVVDVRVDCDADALVMRVEPRGPACHTGARTCFHRELDDAPSTQRETATVAAASRSGGATSDATDACEIDLAARLQKLYALIEERRAARPAGSYTTYLFDAGLDKILKKVGEESAETIIAAKNEDAGALVAEASDLLYHLLVLFVARGVTLAQIEAELARRAAPGKDEASATDE
jgi:phosphoribosyl-ATP pyrophosphohydrolase/phosphoribosyl-AMP cyclohydrolase